MFLTKKTTQKTKKNKVNLKGYKVFTQSGFKLGKVVGVLYDEYSKNILNIVVKRTIFFFAVGKELIIHKSQIVQIKQKKVIVEDAFVKNKGKIIYSPENA